MQTNTLLKFTNSNTNNVVASNAISNIIATRAKPFSDGDYIINLKQKLRHCYLKNLKKKSKLFDAERLFIHNQKYCKISDLKNFTYHKSNTFHIHLRLTVEILLLPLSIENVNYNLYT